MKTIRPGQLVYWHDQAAIVLELKGFSEAILRTVNDSRTEIGHVRDIRLHPASSQRKAASHLLAAKKEWNKALERYEIIRPLLENPQRETGDIRQIAKAAGKSLPTVYRWLKRFEETGLVSTLLRPERSDKGNSRLNEEVSDIISTQIGTHFLKKERPSVAEVYQVIKEKCIDDDLPYPCRNTVYARVRALEQREVLNRRYSSKQAREKYEPLKGKFPGADFPNAVVQIDHTPVDVIVVDSEHRLPIGRPYLTLAIDVATKMVTGFHMTFDPPSSSSAGLCIAHAVSQKEHWLAKRDLLAEWPIFGKMQKIHVDNAKEFHGQMLKRACEEHGIILEHRPKGLPNYGPHIERAFRTFMKKCQTLEGTTFSNVQSKLDYDAEGRASLTLEELELWFTIYVVFQYHHKRHKGNKNIPPINAYHQFIHGSATQPGIGLPAPIEDEEKFRLDFTPYFNRTVQRDGIVLDHIRYYAPTLRRWIESVDPVTQKKRTFIVARDPRDISVVYFFDPDTRSYCPIPYLDSSQPAISLWELKASVKKILESPASEVNESTIFAGAKKMRAIEAAGVEKTRLARQRRATEKRALKKTERRKGGLGIHTKNVPQPVVVHQLSEEAFDDDLQPFDDIILDNRPL